MLNRLWKNSAGGNAGQVPPGAPSFLAYHESVFAPLPGGRAPGFRAIFERPEAGYAALVKSNQGRFIINRYDTDVAHQLSNIGARGQEQMEILRQLVLAAPTDPVVLDVGADFVRIPEHDAHHLPGGCAAGPAAGHTSA